MIGQLYRVETRTFCCGVSVFNGYVVADTAPILHRFIGQPFGNLKRWIAKLGGKIEPMLHQPEKGLDK